MSGDLATPAEKLAALNERLKGTAVLSLLNIKSKPAPEALAQRVGELRDVVFDLCSHLAPDDPVRATALERLKAVELLLNDPLEWHILARALELRQDPSDPQLRAVLEASFYEEHVPRIVWQNAPADGRNTELRRSLRLPMLIDVEVDIGGKRTRCQMQNLSRDGICLEVPAGFSASQLNMVLQIPTGAQIAVAGDVVWREAGRIGVAFKIGVAEQNALDASLQSHFTSLTNAVERWRAVAPKSSNAIACAAIVGYAASTLPSNRREHLERLAAAAQADTTAKELQLALAKLQIEERDFAGATQVLKRVVRADREDPRYRLLQLTLDQRSGRKGAGIGLRERIVTAARVPLIVLSTAGLVGALAFVAVSMRGPFVDAHVPAGGLPCESLKLLEPNALCFVDAARYAQVSVRDRALLADTTLQALTARNVQQITVFGTNEEGILDIFDALALQLLRASKP